MGCSREPQYLFVCKCLTGPQTPAVLRILSPDGRGPSVKKRTQILGHHVRVLVRVSVGNRGAGPLSLRGFMWIPGLQPHRGSQELPWSLNPAVFPALHLPTCRLFLCEALRVVLCPGWTQERSDWVTKRKMNILWYWPYVESKIMVPMRLFTKERHRWRKQT